MNYWLWKIAYYVLIIPVFITLPLLTLLPESSRKDVLTASAPILKPLTINMLFPGLLKGPSVFIESNVDKKDSDRLLLFFAGNNNTSAEALTILQHIPFSDQTVADTTVMPSVSIPLIYQPNQVRYIEALRLKIESYIQEYPNLKTLYIAGHSLGAAISIQILVELIPHYPHLEFLFTADRSFQRLWDVAEFRYGKTLAQLMKKTFGLIWEFDSIKALEILKQYPQLTCFFYQVSYDEVLGDGALLINPFLEQPSSFPKTWKLEYTRYDNDGPIHALAYQDLIKRTDIKKSVTLVQGVIKKS
jgi:hypothetical protein